VRYGLFQPGRGKVPRIRPHAGRPGDTECRARATYGGEGAKALLDEAATLFLSGEPDTARLILRDLVNATVGFENLAEMTHKPSKSLHRMLSPNGNPSMDNLAAIFGAVRNWLKVTFDVRVGEAA
jgi:DNA-binding phage protein